MAADFIRHISNPRQYSAGSDGDLCGTSFISRADFTKDLGARIAMKRINCSLGKIRNQTYGVRQDILNMLLANAGDLIR
jgi:hypothetical protein